MRDEIGRLASPADGIYTAIVKVSSAKEVRGQLLITSQSGSVKAKRGWGLHAHPQYGASQAGGCSCTCLETPAASGGARGGTNSSLHFPPFSFCKTDPENR